MNEIELKFLNIDVPSFEEKLKMIGAKFVRDDSLEEWLFWRPEWKEFRGRVRLRTSGDVHQVAYKETTRGTGEGNLELEFEVSDSNTALKFLKKVISSEDIRHQQKRRKSYSVEMDGVPVTIDIDFWPRIPPYVEIESTDRAAIDKVVSLLGLDLKDAVELDARDIYGKIYGIEINGIKELVF
ncbi:MAG: hypothetical protein M3Q44_02685 [bacterium]|nr:hypothetical protein [bacterium]